MMSQSIGELLDYGKSFLSEQEQPLLEAQVLLCHILDCDRSALYAWPEKIIDTKAIQQYHALLQRRKDKEPIAYLLGYKEFWSLKFKVTQDTLIPRMETETLVQAVLDHFDATTSRTILDLGTGCGNIACALAHARPDWQLVGVDVSEKALAIARENVQNLQLNQVELLQSDWFSALKGRQFDAIVGNPPYIRAYDIYLRFGDVTFEPSLALTPGATGLEAFDRILKEVPHYLKPHGLLAFEHGFDQGLIMQEKFQQAGFDNIKSLRDLAGLDRVVLGTYR